MYVVLVFMLRPNIVDSSAISISSSRSMVLNYNYECGETITPVNQASTVAPNILFKCDLSKIEVFAQVSKKFVIAKVSNLMY